MNIYGLAWNFKDYFISLTICVRALRKDKLLNISLLFKFIHLMILCKCRYMLSVWNRSCI